jgi:mRNA-degrading endonuclease toxin of MazEF toxin-antitoxin module
MPMYWTPPPHLGDIVQCRFPRQVGHPGPKERPALILQVEEAADDPTGSVVVVAYATSQKVRTLYPGEFVIEAARETGLTKLTKFDLVNHHRLPFDTDWFGPAPGHTPAYPRRGHLDLGNVAIKRKLQSALLEARAMPRLS